MFKVKNIEKKLLQTTNEMIGPRSPGYLLPKAEIMIFWCFGNQRTAKSGFVP